MFGLFGEAARGVGMRWDFLLGRNGPPLNGAFRAVCHLDAMHGNLPVQLKLQPIAVQQQRSRAKKD